MNNAILVILSLFLFSACTNLKNMSSSALPYKSSAFLVKKSQQNDLQYEWFSAKMNGTVMLDDKSFPLSSNIRMQKDSIIWISATALLGIEAIRLVITPDSFKMVNRLNSTYILSDIDSLSSRFGIHFSFNELQNRLLGDLDLEKLKWKSSLDSANYILKHSDKKTQTTVKINPSFFGVEWSQNKDSNNSMLLNYTSFTSYEQGYLPQTVSLHVEKQENKLQLNYRYSKIIFDQKKKVKFTIPKGYEPAL